MKFLNIGAKDRENNVARALSVNSKGVLETTDGDVEKTAFALRKKIEEQQYNLNDVYDNGWGYNHFELDSERSTGNHTFSAPRTRDHMELTTLNNVSQEGRAAIVSSAPVVKTGEKPSKIVVEYTLETENNRNVQVQIWYRDSKSHANRTSSVQRYDYVGKQGKRQLLEFDVSNRPSDRDWYLELSLYEPPSSLPANAVLKIYNVYTASDSNTTTVSNGGSLSVKDTDGNPVDLTAEMDDNDKAVLRVFDSAPHNQDMITDSVRNLPQTKVRMDDVFEGTLEAQEQKVVSVRFENESKVWFHVESSQENWSLMSGTIYKMDGNRYATFFPDVSTPQPNIATTSHPKIARFIGVTSEQIGFPLESIQDAEAWAIPPGNHTIDFYLKNGDVSSGDFKLRVVRVWGV